MGSTIYFGNRQKQLQIPAPDSGMDWSDVRRTNLIQLHSGGVYVDDSNAWHREGMAEWQIQDPVAFRAVREFRDGVWGDGPFYWVDPFGFDTNLLSPSWAAPGIIAKGDWMEIAPVPNGGAANVEAGILGTPTRAITYAPLNAVANPATPAQRFTVIIPPGYKLAFGAHGYATGAAVVALRSTLSTGAVGSTVSFAPLNPTSSVAFSSTDLFPYSEGHRVVDIYIGRTSAVASTLTLSAMRARLVREGETLATTGHRWVSGEGVGALAFSGGIRETLQWAPPGRPDTERRKGFAVKLVEIGDWA